MPAHLTACLPPSPPQMADMYGEVMDLNSELHKRIQEQEKDIRQLRAKLLQVCCVSPGPAPLMAGIVTICSLSTEHIQAQTKGTTS